MGNDDRVTVTDMYILIVYALENIANPILGEEPTEESAEESTENTNYHDLLASRAIRIAIRLNRFRHGNLHNMKIQETFKISRSVVKAFKYLPTVSESVLAGVEVVMSLGKKITIWHSREGHTEGTLVDAFPDPDRPSYYFLSVEGYEDCRFSLVCWQKFEEVKQARQRNVKIE